MFPGRLRNVHGLTQNNEPHNTDYQINDNLQIFQIEVKFFSGAGSREQGREDLRCAIHLLRRSPISRPRPLKIGGFGGQSVRCAMCDLRIEI